MGVACTQCGASIEPRAGERLLECPYCDTALVVDGSATLIHEVMAPTVAYEQVPAHLRRFLGGTSTVADLDHDQLFYLMSRGLSEEKARTLLVKAFVAEIVDELDNEDLAGALEARLETWLADDE